MNIHSDSFFSSSDVHSTFYSLVFGAVNYWLPDKNAWQISVSECDLREATWAGGRSGGTWPLSPGHVTWPGYYPGCWFCTLCNRELRGEAALLKCQEWRPGYLYRPGECRERRRRRRRRGPGCLSRSPLPTPPAGAAFGLSLAAGRAGRHSDCAFRGGWDLGD